MLEMDQTSIITMLFGLLAFFFFLQIRDLGKQISEIKKNQQLNTKKLNFNQSELRKINQILITMNGSDIIQEAINQGQVVESKLYVGNIDYSASENELEDYFSQCGEVEFVNIPVNRYTGKARGFGFVTFACPDAAERAMDLNGSTFKGREIHVNLARERNTG